MLMPTTPAQGLVDVIMKMMLMNEKLFASLKLDEYFVDEMT